MERKALDASVLITHWHSRCVPPLRARQPAEARKWAKELIKLRKSDAIVTPVYLEFICGVTSVHELNLARAYLAEFRLVDDGRILAEDWEDAQRLAARVPRDGTRRQLGDCLIRAIANRLRYDVDTFDAAFPR
jgi:predicted nucleic acid-binding protein